MLRRVGSITSDGQRDDGAGGPRGAKRERPPSAEPHPDERVARARSATDEDGLEDVGIALSAAPTAPAPARPVVPRDAPDQTALSKTAAAAPAVEHAHHTMSHASALASTYSESEDDD